MNESLLANCPECGTLLPSPVHALVGQNVLFVKCNACKKIYTILSCSDSVNIKLDRMGQDFSSCLRNYFPRTEKESVVANVFTQKLPEHSNGVFSLRHGQRALAVAVMRALESKSDLLADAGVGIGKSFAYLVPILHEGRGLFVISTSTLVLQEQLADDIRQLAKLLHRPEPEVVVSKGERNYICFMRLEQILSQEGIDQRLKDEARIVRKSLNRLQSSSNCNDIGSWERETAGALNVSPQLRKFVIVNQQVSSEHQHSDCNTCASREMCGYQIMCSIRRKPSSRILRILIVNHGLLLSDLKLRDSSDTGGLWPEPNAIIIDEAHDLENKARMALTASIRPREIHNMRRTLSQAFSDAVTILGDLEEATMSLMAAVSFARRNYAEYDADRIPLDANVKKLAIKVGTIAERVFIACSVRSGFSGSRTVQNALRNLEDWEECARHLRSGDPGVSTAIEGTNVTASPGSISERLRQILFSHRTPIILCSGTLLCGSNFSELRQNLGVCHTKTVNCLMANSPFNYEQRLKIFVSSKFMRVPRAHDPSENDYMHDFLLPSIEQLIHASQGRALILCTSRHRARIIYDYLATKSPHRVLWQEDFEAIDVFSRDTNSILIGTGKLFSGIDIPGESLSLLIIDRIPFPVPEDPLYVAKEALALAAGRSPEQARWDWARATLSQGAGRLIRSMDDWGVIAIMDPRAAPGNGIHESVKRALPPGEWLSTIEEVETFFKTGPIIPDGVDNVSTIKEMAVKFGESPRICYGFAPDAIKLNLEEDPYEESQVVYPWLATLRQNAKVIYPIAVPNAQELAKQLASEGCDILLTSVRAGPWAKLLSDQIPEVTGRAFPIPAPERWMFVAFMLSQASERDRMEVGIMCAHLTKTMKAMIITADEDQTQSLRRALDSEGEWNGLDIRSLSDALLDINWISKNDFLVILDLPHETDYSLDLVRLISLVAFDGVPRCLLIVEPNLVSEPGPLIQAVGLSINAEKVRYQDVIRAFKRAKALNVRR